MTGLGGLSGTLMISGLPPATLDSRVTEMVERRVAETDYTLKKRARFLLDLLAGLQARRRGGDDA